MPEIETITQVIKKSRTEPVARVLLPARLAPLLAESDQEQLIV